MTFLVSYFYVNWFTFFVCFKLKSYINIKITKAKRKICFWGFSSLQYFFSLQTWQQRISHRQPQIQTNRYQVHVLSCQWNYTISRSFSRLNDWTLQVSLKIALIFQYSCLSHIEHSFLLLLWDLSLSREQSIFAW